MYKNFVPFLAHPNVVQRCALGLLRLYRKKDS